MLGASLSPARHGGASVLRQPRTAASSRKNESDNSLSGIGQALEPLDRDEAVDAFEQSGRSSAAMSRYVLPALRLRPNFEDDRDHSARSGASFAASGERWRPQVRPTPASRPPSNTGRTLSMSRIASCGAQRDDLAQAVGRVRIALEHLQEQLARNADDRGRLVRGRGGGPHRLGQQRQLAEQRTRARPSPVERRRAHRPTRGVNDPSWIT